MWCKEHFRHFDVHHRQNTIKDRIKVQRQEPRESASEYSTLIHTIVIYMSPQLFCGHLIKFKCVKDSLNFERLVQSHCTKSVNYFLTITADSSTIIFLTSYSDGLCLFINKIKPIDHEETKVWHL